MLDLFCQGCGVEKARWFLHFGICLCDKCFEELKNWILGVFGE